MEELIGKALGAALPTPVALAPLDGIGKASLDAFEAVGSGRRWLLDLLLSELGDDAHILAAVGWRCQIDFWRPWQIVYRPIAMFQHRWRGIADRIFS